MPVAKPPLLLVPVIVADEAEAAYTHAFPPDEELQQVIRDDKEQHAAYEEEEEEPVPIQVRVAMHVAGRVDDD
jgi:hypothetical protein